MGIYKYMDSADVCFALRKRAARNNPFRCALHARARWHKKAPSVDAGKKRGKLSECGGRCGCIVCLTCPQFVRVSHCFEYYIYVNGDGEDLLHIGTQR